ncbi:O-methyltransferase [Psychromarinibacter sp. S121]|uniref:O-methyltransferase n=1 Tax=Psychromarinibacter sp. S121 TaxID=3415127 RepID=UPI003C7A234E
MDWLPKDPQIADELARLHEAADRSTAERRERGGFKPEENTDDIVRLGSEYLALSPEEGRFVYMMALGAQARTVVEFGASFGISTLYFAAAMRETGGRLITTEVHPDKCNALRDTFARAGVEDIVTLLEGDARETLKQVEGPVDLLFLDGWKSMYLTVLDLLTPVMRPGAMVIGDNLNLASAQEYSDRVSDPANGFLTQILGRTGLSVKLD